MKKLVVVAFLLAGCADVWVKDGLTEAEQKQEIAACRDKAEKAHADVPSPDRRNRLVHDDIVECLRGKGFRYT